MVNDNFSTDEIKTSSSEQRSILKEEIPITVAYGDGIGPEIMEATLRIMKAAGARIRIETIQIGESVYKKGISSGTAPYQQSVCVLYHHIDLPHFP